MTQGDPAKPAVPDFASPAEFAALCDGIAGRLHVKNRTSMNESVFVWHVAQMMTRLGRVFAEHYDNDSTYRAFGDGWSRGALPDDAKAAALIALMYPELGQPDPEKGPAS